jgi:transposase
MRFVPVKSVEQQSMLVVHRLREGLEEDRTACINRIRGLLLEFGVAIAEGVCPLELLLDDVLEDACNEMNFLARIALQRAQAQWRELDAHLAWCDERIAEHAKNNDAGKRAGELMGIGPIGAPAAVVTFGDFKQLESGSQLGGLGLVPNSDRRAARATWHDHETRRRVPSHAARRGAKSVVNSAHTRSDPISCWVLVLKLRSGWQKAVVALANKNARILWAMMTKGDRFDRRHVSEKPKSPTPTAAQPAAAT